MENNNEEQLLENNDVNLNQGMMENENKQDKELFSGSSTKKFKSVEALENAYENLEKEFTKKCQMLNKLLSENKDENSLPQYQKEDWLTKVSTFIENNNHAKDFLNDIAKTLVEDENLAKKEDALELAYSKVLKDNFKTKEELASDDNFLNDYIFNNEEIKNKIIENYLTDVQNNKTIPLMINRNGSLSVSSPRFIPKNLKEAGRYAENILRK
ncbi:MAG: hypothetical protein ACI4T1_00785 [Christensenellales bacterium]